MSESTAKREVGTPQVKRGMAQMLKGGVIMDVTNPREAEIAQEAGAVAVMALEAGNDLVITTDYRTQIPKVLEALESGALSEETIDTACRRVLTWKQNLGLL